MTVQKRQQVHCLPILSTLFFLATGMVTAQAQTSLEAGDIAFTGYITADDNNVTQDDVISFVLLKDMDVNTVIYFTDFGWTDAGTFQTVDPCGGNTGAYNDGIIRWTSTSVLSCGTQVSINCRKALTASSGTVTGISPTFNNANVYLSLATSGDQVLAFQGTTANPVFIAGISINRDWDTVLDSCDFTSSRSTLPVTLGTLGTALFPDAVNAQYNCSTTSGDTLSLLSAISIASSWNTDTSSVPPVAPSFQLPPPCTFSGCALPVPQITVHPLTQTLCENSNFSLFIQAGNASAYQWQQNIGGTWVNVTDTLPFSGSQDDTLHFSGIPFALNSRPFRCMAYGAAPPAAVSNAAILTVLPAPNITAQTPARAICEGLNVSFSVSASGTGLGYQWQFDNGGGWTNLSNTPPYSGATTSALLITATPFSLHLTNYRCIVSGSCAPADTSAPVYVFVNILPNVTLEPQADSICAGSSTVFIVNAVGSSAAYRWQINTGSGFSNLNNGAPFTGVFNDTLTVTNPALIYNGAEFRCVVSGVCSPADTSMAVKLTIGGIPGAPVFQNTSVTYCDNDSNVIFSVSPVDAISTYSWSYTGTNAVLSTAGDTSATLSFSNAGSGDSLQVKAQNFCGSGASAFLLLTVHESYSLADTLRLCPGDSLQIHGNWQSVPGNYIQVFSAVNGCDSLFITTLENYPVYSTPLQATICNGDSVFAGGAWQSQAGTYTDTLTSVHGCDSLLVTMLAFFPVPFDSVQVFVCSGDSIFLGGGWQSLAGTYADTLSSVNGCDSLLFSNLGFFAPAFDSLQIGICQGDSIWIGGNWQSSPGNFIDTLISTNGCDSLLYTELIVHPHPLVTLSLDTVICSTASPLQLFGEDPPGGTWSGMGVSGNTFDPAFLGFGFFLVTYDYSDMNGCFGSATDTVYIADCTGIGELNGTRFTMYPNPASDFIRIDVSGPSSSPLLLRISDAAGREVWRSTLSGHSLYLALDEFENGVYHLQLSDQKKSIGARLVIIR
ncbi:MAG: T9SS type A sorting domain-containing protein [Bacteroidia bacterium]|nr:T9SS type A sorting domain-containing protein [Bacteroidia bacterium]